MDNYDKSTDPGHLLFLELMDTVQTYYRKGTQWDKIEKAVRSFNRNITGDPDEFGTRER